MQQTSPCGGSATADAPAGSSDDRTKAAGKEVCAVKTPEDKLTMVDYRNLRLRTLNTAPYRHVRLLLFWPIFTMVFALLEQGGMVTRYYPVACHLDYLIPFCEYFIIPYLFWFIFVAGILVYGLLFEVETFRRCMWFIIITYSVTLLIYMVFPNSQHLRPVFFPRDNVFARLVARFYLHDTNTNVCPSIHVIGSLAVCFAAWNSRRLGTLWWRTAFVVMTVLISISTVFLKQHSVLDVLAALALCAVVYPFVYRRRPQTVAAAGIGKPRWTPEEGY